VALVGRFFVIIFALFLAALAAAIAVTFAVATFALRVPTGDPIEQMFVWGLSLLASGVAAFGAFLPTLIAVAVAEIFAIRSALIYALGGAVVMLIGYYSAGLASTYAESIDVAPPMISREVEIIAAMGVVFGLTYWVIAGRRAGAWLKRQPRPSA
jgi:hypothetical protein